MAPLPVIADVVRVAIDWSNSFVTKPATNVMHFSAPGKTLAQVFTALDNRVVTNMWCGATVDTKAITVTLTPLDGSGSTLVQPVTPAAKWAGPAVTGDVVPQVAAIIKFATAKRGRSFRGRIFVPFTAEAQQSSGVVTPATVAAATAAWATWLTNMNGDGVHPVVASYKLGSAEAITAATAEAMTATQRRRQFR